MIPDYLYVQCYYDRLSTLKPNGKVDFYKAIQIGIEHSEMKEKYFKPEDKEYFTKLWQHKEVITIRDIANRLLVDENMPLEEFMVKAKFEYSISEIIDIV